MGEAEAAGEPEREEGRGSAEGPGGVPEPPGEEGSPDAGEEDGRIVPGRNREAQVRRAGGRKLFDDEAKLVFLEWFAATCNAGWAAERAGFNYKTVWKHRMNDPVFAEEYDRAEEQAVARLRAKRLETRRKPLKRGIEGDWDAPEMDDIDPILASTLLREHDGKAGRPRKTGRIPRVASNAEVRAALVKRLAAYGVRVFGEPPEAGGPLHHKQDGSVPGTEEISNVPGTEESSAPHCPARSGEPGDPLISDGPPPSDPDGVAHGEES